MNQPDPPYGDDTASELLHRVLDLALVVRDEGPTAVSAALDDIGDIRAALVVAAAAIRVDLPLDRWWDRPVPLGGHPVHPENAPVVNLCKRCDEPIEGRHKRAAYCTPCQGIVRRATFRRNTDRQRGRTVAA